MEGLQELSHGQGWVGALDELFGPYRLAVLAVAAAPAGPESGDEEQAASSLIGRVGTS